MSLLKKQLEARALQGIIMDRGADLLYQIFADNTGLFFTATKSNFAILMEVIHI
jgi:hypothetical protein